MFQRPHTEPRHVIRDPRAPLAASIDRPTGAPGSQVLLSLIPSKSPASHNLTPFVLHLHRLPTQNLLHPSRPTALSYCCTMGNNSRTTGCAVLHTRVVSVLACLGQQSGSSQAQFDCINNDQCPNPGPFLRILKCLSGPMKS